MNWPLRRSSGSSSAKATPNSCGKVKSTPAKKAAALASSWGGPAASSLTPHSRAANSPSRNAARSRGPPRSRASRPNARIISGTPFKPCRTSIRISGSLARKPTASWRAAILAQSRRGAASQSASVLAPAGVVVRSRADKSEPSRLPESVRANSRLARVAASISRVALSCARLGRDRRGREANCVSSI